MVEHRYAETQRKLIWASRAEIRNQKFSNEIFLYLLGAVLCLCLFLTDNSTFLPQLPLLTFILGPQTPTQNLPVLVTIFNQEFPISLTPNIQEMNPLDPFQFTPHQMSHKLLETIQLGQVPIFCSISCCKGQDHRDHTYPTPASFLCLQIKFY